MAVLIHFFCKMYFLYPSQSCKKKLAAFFGVLPPKKTAKFFLRLRDAYKKYFLQKNWVKTAIPALSSGQSNLHPPIWGRHRQLDDPHRNPNSNDRDHLVGQLTNLREVHHLQVLISHTLSTPSAHLGKVFSTLGAPWVGASISCRCASSSVKQGWPTAKHEIE